MRSVLLLTQSDFTGATAELTVIVPPASSTASAAPAPLSTSTVIDSIAQSTPVSSFTCTLSWLSLLRIASTVSVPRSITPTNVSLELICVSQPIAAKPIWPAPSILIKSVSTKPPPCFNPIASQPCTMTSPESRAYCWVNATFLFPARSSNPVMGFALLPRISAANAGSIYALSTPAGPSLTKPSISPTR